MYAHVLNEIKLKKENQTKNLLISYKTSYKRKNISLVLTKLSLLLSTLIKKNIRIFIYVFCLGHLMIF